MIRKFVLAIGIAGMVSSAAITHAASVKLAVDPKGQDFDSIRIHMANIPMDFVWSDPPAYAGMGEPIPDTANHRRIEISGLTPGQTYKFIAVLTKGTEHSPGSNIIQQKMPVVVIKLEAASMSVIEVRGE